MKVHVTLRDEFRKALEAKRLAFEHIVQACGLHSINQKRFERYGILSGELDEDQFEVLQQLEEVRAVERDSEKFAI